jgi:outer membrane protein
MRKARYFFTILIAVIFVATLVSGALAANIGYIDVTTIFKEYKETEKAEERLKKEKESYEKEFKEAQEKLEKAEKDKKSVEEIEKLRGELEEKLEPKRISLFKLNEELTTKIQNDIVSAVKDVSKKVGIDIVVDKQAIITGGVDLTEMVLNKLNK